MEIPGSQNPGFQGKPAANSACFEHKAVTVRRQLGCAGGQGRQHGAAGLSAGLISWPRSHCSGMGCSKQTVGWKPKCIQFLEVALKCRCTTRLQTSALDAGNAHPPNLMLPTQAQRVLFKCPCCVGGRTVHVSCLQTCWPFHRLLFQSW